MNQSKENLAAMWRPSTRCALLLLGLALSSCTIGPEYQRPEAKLPERYEAATTQEAAEPELGRDWWRVFGDPVLNRLEEEAVSANHDLQAAMARVEQARAAARIAKSDFYPLVTLDPSYTRSRTPG